jgi:hypothetical protein
MREFADGEQRVETRKLRVDRAPAMGWDSLLLSTLTYLLTHSPHPGPGYPLGAEGEGGMRAN